MLNNRIDVLKRVFRENIVIFLAMLYITFKLTCNPLFFRQITISLDFLSLNLKILSSSLIFSVTYMLSDMILTVSNRRTAIAIAVIGILSDGVFSFIISFVSQLPIPSEMMALQLKNTYAVNQFGSQVWSLFVHGMFATILSNVAEILIFERIFRKIKSFFVSSISSVLLILLCHNVINDYPMLREQASHWQIIFDGILVNISVMVVYALIFSFIIQFRKRINGENNLNK